MAQNPSFSPSEALIHLYCRGWVHLQMANGRPSQVSAMLDRLYCAFDALAEKHGVYKIDTIGDGQ